MIEVENDNNQTTDIQTGIEEDESGDSDYSDLESEEDDENMKEIRQLAGKIRIKKKLMKNDRKIDRLVFNFN